MSGSTAALGPAAAFLAAQIERLRSIRPRRRIVFPEGHDPRVQEAAARLEQEGLVTPFLSVPQEATAKYAQLYFERRRLKGITEQQACQIASTPLYAAALMVASGDADGFVGGAVNTTAETVRASLQCIGPAPGVETVSGCFIVVVEDKNCGHNGAFVFADCAIVVEPSAVELAEIAIATAETTRRVLNAEPVIAMLSFSTKGSAQHVSIDRTLEAVKIVRGRQPGLKIDGELQGDAAVVESIAQSKAPGSVVAGRANTLIFPNLDAANISYKLVQRLGGAMALGPFLQGLAEPANDLSRGCSVDDIYGVAIVTALQSSHASV
jgi:phosphate acetyltransferase